jgi:translation initiation factor IF-2
MRPRGLGTLSRQKTGGGPVTQERSAHKKVIKIEASVGLQQLAQKISVKATDVLMKLIKLGLTGVNINSTLDADTAKIVANEFGWEVEDVAVSEEDALVAAQGIETEIDDDKQPRAPVVTVMGHVDHGKTSLLDKVRKANVVAGEAGGITQHIGAYSVETQSGKVTFLDTPGHAAFTAMRARGAQTTDIVILVVAADDGVMPQTIEAINHAKAARVPIVVAVNKIDKPDAAPERVRRELSEQGLIPEEWGGETLFTEVSAMTGQGIDALLEKVALQAEVLELRANADKPGSGVVVEAELDRGKGPVATVLITEGTLRRGDVVLAGRGWGKVRAMHDDRGRMVAAAGPSTPVSIIGLSEVPDAGDPVHVVTDMKKAQEIADQRKSKERRSILPTAGKVSLEELARALAESDQLELKLIIKADVQGSVEALADALTKLSTQKVKVGVVHAAVGAITEGDVNLAVAAKAIIIGFNVRPAGKASGLAQKEGIEIRQYSIIYNVVDDVKAAMEGLLAPTLVEKVLGHAEVRQIFKLSKAGMIAGCMVIDGIARRNASARLLRDGAIVWTGKVTSLKRFKEDVREVKEGFDCGIGLENYNDIKERDVVEFLEMEEVKQTL